MCPAAAWLPCSPDLAFVHGLLCQSALKSPSDATQPSLLVHWGAALLPSANLRLPSIFTNPSLERQPTLPVVHQPHNNSIRKPRTTPHRVAPLPGPPAGSGPVAPEQRQGVKLQAVAFLLYASVLSAWECWRLWSEMAHAEDARLIQDLPLSIAVCGLCSSFDLFYLPTRIIRYHLVVFVG